MGPYDCTFVLPVPMGAELIASLAGDDQFPEGRLLAPGDPVFGRLIRPQWLTMESFGAPVILNGAGAHGSREVLFDSALEHVIKCHIALTAVTESDDDDAYDVPAAGGSPAAGDSPATGGSPAAAEAGPYSFEYGAII
jgi:hypothetical protein